jgi:hypothetical protein
MSRAERLLSLMEILRRHRAPAGGARLAAELGISLRSLYRDIGAPRGQGADIGGEAGVGYVLRPGFTPPPLMFSRAEIEAIVLGSRWVAQRGDDELAPAARHAPRATRSPRSSPCCRPEHVRTGRALGFMRVCHGKRGPLARVRPGDGIVSDSPAPGFAPFRRDVVWREGEKTPIEPLPGALEFRAGKRD